MIRVAYSKQSAPSAYKLAEVDENIELVRSSSELTDVNWGRRTARSELNPDISNSVNKRIMRELFASHDVPRPALYRPDEALIIARAFPDRRLLGRPDEHTRGRGFWLCRGEDDIKKALLGTRSKRAATHFMEYIEKERAPREYRVHIFRGESIRLSEKQPDESEIGYRTVPATHNVNHVRQAAKRAIEAVGLDFGAVDVIANDAQCWVLEVNAAPGLGGTMPSVYVKAFRRGSYE